MKAEDFVIPVFVAVVIGLLLLGAVNSSSNEKEKDKQIIEVRLYINDAAVANYIRHSLDKKDTIIVPKDDYILLEERYKLHKEMSEIVKQKIHQTDSVLKLLKEKE